ncbi:uncharacterized protein LOC134706009 [Mytilus trossulus]|uniref:uncharacterized protein LOC134706009 n=1 Tax=Mytilus trossulus TaxID=6551 RepID=UPI003005229D
MADQRETDRLSEVVAIGLNAIDNTVSTESRPGAIMVESVFDRTLRAFSRHRSAPGPSQRKKKGEIPKELTFHLFLLAKRSDFLPPTTELDRLTRNGLGVYDISVSYPYFYLRLHIFIIPHSNTEW